VHGNGTGKECKNIVHRLITGTVPEKQQYKVSDEESHSNVNMMVTGMVHVQEWP
jgi:hypothetical protein